MIKKGRGSTASSEPSRLRIAVIFDEQGTRIWWPNPSSSGSTSSKFQDDTPGAQMRDGARVLRVASERKWENPQTLQSPVSGLGCNQFKIGKNSKHSSKITKNLPSFSSLPSGYISNIVSRWRPTLFSSLHDQKEAYWAREHQRVTCVSAKIQNLGLHKF